MAVLRVNRQIYGECQQILSAARATTSIYIRVDYRGTGYVNGLRPGMINSECFDNVMGFLGESHNLHINLLCCEFPNKACCHHQSSNTCIRATGTTRTIHHIMQAIRERQKARPWKKLTIECDIEALQGTVGDSDLDENHIKSNVISILRPFETLRRFEAVVVRFTGLINRTRPHLVQFKRLLRIKRTNRSRSKALKNYIDELTRMMCRKDYDEVDFDAWKEDSLCHHGCQVRTPITIKRSDTSSGKREVDLEMMAVNS